MAEFKGIRSIANSKSAKEKVLTPKIHDEQDKIVTSGKGIANTFAEFHSNLHAKEEHDEHAGVDEGKTTQRHTEKDAREEQRKRNNENSEAVDENENQKDRSEHILEFTKQELRAAIDSLKKRKSGDCKGIRAEDIKESDDETKETMREIFKRHHQTRKHDPWRKVTIKVIYWTGICSETRKLPTVMNVGYAVQGVFRISVQKAAQQTRQPKTPRP